MNDARITTKEIEHIILVGGTSKMPLVQQMVESLFLKKTAIEIDPEKAVALGAAIQAGIMTKQVEDILILDAIALSLGIETLGGAMTKLIERNTTLPVRKSQVFQLLSIISLQPLFWYIKAKEKWQRIINCLEHFILRRFHPHQEGFHNLKYRLTLMQMAYSTFRAKS